MKYIRFGRKKEAREENLREVTADQLFDDQTLRAYYGGTIVTKRQAMEIPELAAGIEKISNSVAMSEIKLYRKTNGDIVEVRDDPRVFMLNHDTGDTLNGFQMKKAIINDCICGGAGYAYIERRYGKPYKIYYVDEKEVLVQSNNDPIFKSLTINVRGQPYSSFDFLKVTRKTKDGVTGIGVIEENNRLLSVAYHTLEYENNLVSNGGNKKGFLKSAKKLTDAAITVLHKAWARLCRNDGDNVMVLNDGLEFQESGITSVDMQLNENTNRHKAAIENLLGISDDETKTRNNAILPVIASFQEALNRDLLLEKEKMEMFFALDLSGLEYGSMKERYENYEIGIKNNWLQIDDVRKKENMPKLNFPYLKMSLSDVFYDPKTGQVYTPNTNSTTKVGENTKGGEEDTNTDTGKPGNA